MNAFTASAIGDGVEHLQIATGRCSQCGHRMGIQRWAAMGSRAWVPTLTSWTLLENTTDAPVECSLDSNMAKALPGSSTESWVPLYNSTILPIDVKQKLVNRWATYGVMIRRMDCIIFDRMRVNGAAIYKSSLHCTVSAVE